jgi:transcriptional regulator with PAS, ATPase and Fis domain
MNTKDTIADVSRTTHPNRELPPKITRFMGGFFQSDEIVGDSEHIQSITACIDRVAPSEAAVLITGETGTGKELFARRVHRKSKRNGRPFISLNCAAIPDALLESELFGFEKGAFTGALARHEGRFVEADTGTIFLDEIGDLSLAAQSKLLRVLEQKVVQPLGARNTRTVDFRLVAATNRDLEQMTARGDFREDLFYRINVIHVHIAPLRDRPEDIERLAEYFLRALGIQYCRPFVSLAPSAQSYLKDRPWLGNARELRNTIERAFFLSSSDRITEQDFARISHLNGSRHESLSTSTSRSLRVDRTVGPRYRTSHSSYDGTTIDWSEVSAVEQLRNALEETRWNKSKTAKLLRCSRMTIHRKVVQFELRPTEPDSTCEELIRREA